MSDYKAVFILNSSQEEKEQKKEIVQLEKIVVSLDGKINKTELIGKKELAYPIKKQTQGTYLKLNFSLEPQKIKDWEEKLKLQDKIIRYLLIKE